MTQQWLRKVSLKVGNDKTQFDLSQMHFRFTVRKTDVANPNVANIRIWNLSEATASAIFALENTKTELQAGYEGSFGLIFKGSLFQCRKGRENATDTYLDILASDGRPAYNEAVINTPVPAAQTGNASVIGMCTATMDPFGIGAGVIPSNLPTTPLPRGKALFGQTRDVLRQQAKTLQSTWSIQDGKLNFMPLTATLQNTAVVLNSATGMIGLPEQTQEGIHVRALLNPNIKIRGLVKIDQKSIQRFTFGGQVADPTINQAVASTVKIAADGIYAVIWLGYAGDTRGQEWYVDLVCMKAGSGAPIGAGQKYGAGPVKAFG